LLLMILYKYKYIRYYIYYFIWELVSRYQ
jgi:hypothetical protein